MFWVILVRINLIFARVLDTQLNDRQKRDRDLFPQPAG